MTKVILCSKHGAILFYAKHNIGSQIMQIAYSTSQHLKQQSWIEHFKMILKIILNDKNEISKKN